MRACLAFHFVFLFFFLPQLDSAQEVQALQVEDFNLIHWAYAPAFGTGVYRVGENREVYVLRVQPMFTYRFKFETVFKDRELVLEFKLPVTFGVYNFNFTDLLGGEFPDSVQQISFTPGVEIKLPVSNRWNLRFYGNLGYGSDTQGGGERAWIYWAGFMSRFVFPIKKLNLGIINGYGSFGYTPNHGKPGDLSRLMNGFELDIPLGRIGSSEKPFFLKSHVLNFWYYDRVDFLEDPQRKPVTIGSEWEIGVAIGKAQRIKIWLFNIDRIGVGYRFSTKANGVRIYFASYFR